MKIVLITSAAILLASSGASRAAETAKSKYYARLAKTSPRDAGAFVELAEWCTSSGLGEEAARAYKEAIAIDTDCEKARSALGYKRYGTGWRRPGEAPEALSRPLRGSRGGAAPGGAPEREAGGATATPASPPAITGAAAASREAPEAGGPDAAPAAGSPPESAGAPPTPEPAAEKKSPPEPAASEPGAVGSSLLDKKREWAKAAAARLTVTLSTVEDADFLLHSTLPGSSREMKALHTYLKSLKKILGTVTGAGVKPWPDKFQVVLLKSEPEYERFAEFVDEMRSAKNPDGAYAVGDHTVLWIPDSGALARIVAESALKNLNGSNRWVPPWVEQGVSEMVHAQSPSGLKDGYYEKTMIFAADIIKGEGEALKIYNLIESRETKRKDEERAEALALSFVDFLLRQNRKGFHDFVKTLKSDKAPAPPAGKDADLGAFHLGFIVFQEETLRKSCGGAAVNVLGDKWKAYVLSAAETLRAREDEKTEPKKTTKTKAKKEKAKEGEKGRQKEKDGGQKG